MYVTFFIFIFSDLQQNKVILYSKCVVAKSYFVLLAVASFILLLLLQSRIQQVHDCSIYGVIHQRFERTQFHPNLLQIVIFFSFFFYMKLKLAELWMKPFTEAYGKTLVANDIGYCQKYFTLYIFSLLIGISLDFIPDEQQSS